MCQLTFTHIYNNIPEKVNLSRIFLETQSFMNSLKDNKDGFGFYSKHGSVFKTELCASLITNLGKIISESVLETPIISHVRKATFTNNVKSIIRENSHPFETDNIILIHNGSFESVDEKLMKEDRFKGMIDSEIFTHILSENYQKGQNFPEVLKDVIDQFYGKFALMIYDKWTDQFYIVRGKSAELYRYNLLARKDNLEIPIGILVNTNKESLQDGITLFSNIAKIVCEIDIIYRLSLFSELEKDTILLLNEKEELMECGKVEEKSKPPIQVKQKTAVNSIYDDGYSHDEDGYAWVRGRNLLSNKDTENGRTNAQKAGDILYQFMSENDISLFEVDYLFHHILGNSLLGAEKSDVETFITKIIPYLNSINHKNKRKEWQIIRRYSGTGFWSLYTYQKYNLKIPYMLNDILILRNLRKNLKSNNINGVEKEM